MFNYVVRRTLQYECKFIKPHNLTSNLPFHTGRMIKLDFGANILESRANSSRSQCLTTEVKHPRRTAGADFRVDIGRD